MLYTIAVVLLVLWLLGMVTSSTMGGLIHVLLGDCHRHGARQLHFRPPAHLNWKTPTQLHRDPNLMKSLL